MISDAYDVVVAGAGLAGCAAALSAAQAGASVLLVEKTAAIGGSSVLSAGGMAFASTPVQAAAGVEDGPTRLRDDLLRMGGGFNVAALVDAYVEHQSATYDWLVAQGLEFASLSVGSGNSVPRVHRLRIREALDTLCTALVTHLGVPW